MFIFVVKEETTEQGILVIRTAANSDRYRDKLSDWFLIVNHLKSAKSGQRSVFILGLHTGEMKKSLQSIIHL